LEQASVIDAVTAANRALAGTASQPAQPTALPGGAVGEPNARLNVVLVVAEAILNSTRRFTRRRDVFITRAEIDRQIRPHLPVIFGVKVRFVDPIFQEERAETFLERRHATGEKRRVSRAEICSAASCAEVVETAREIVSEVIELLAANVRASLDEMPVAQYHRLVINELVISLESIDRKSSGIADDRAGHR
jgi:hypothetical protein